MSEPKRDLIEQILEEGDWVVSNLGKYGDLAVGKIIRISEKKIRIEWLERPTGMGASTLRYPRQVVKLHNADEAITAYLLRKTR
jgi:hypothetical protein